MGSGNSVNLYRMKPRSRYAIEVNTDPVTMAAIRVFLGSGASVRLVHEKDGILRIDAEVEAEGIELSMYPGEYLTNDSNHFSVLKKHSFESNYEKIGIDGGSEITTFHKIEFSRWDRIRILFGADVVSVMKNKLDVPVNVLSTNLEFNVGNKKGDTYELVPEKHFMK